MRNDDLRKLYDKVYSQGADNFFSKNSFQESITIQQMCSDWNGLSVLEIGCGSGKLAALLGFSGALVDAVDYSEEAIKVAVSQFNIPGVTYSCKDFQSIKGSYDAIIMQGVLEHMDDPFNMLTTMLKSNLNENGFIITSSPSFLNPRGYIWMTLQLLFDIPMSLTDLHFLCPFDFEEFALANNLNLEYHSVDHERGAGELAIVDLKKRLTNALSDAGYKNDEVDRLLNWFSKAAKYYKRENYSGATVIYKMARSNLQ
jgi:SAM-dependent methyltransferase